MDYCPNLQRQKSCPSFISSDSGGWRSRSRRTVGYHRQQYLDNFCFEDDESVDRMNIYPSKQSLIMRWRRLWRKIVREKRRFVSSVAPVRVPLYDQFSYAQNFDEGAAQAEPENFSRSFSVRFAGPARMLHRVA